MQLLLSFLRTSQPAGAAPIWDALDDEQRAEVVTMLARLIAKVAAVQSEKVVKRYPTNWELAGARAASVVRLFGDQALAASRLLAVSVADTQPVDSNDTPEGRAKNRRIEIRLRPVVVEE